MTSERRTPSSVARQPSPTSTPGPESSPSPHTSPAEASLSYGLPPGSLNEVMKLHDFDLLAHNDETDVDERLRSILSNQAGAEEFFESYRAMSPSFPFVPISTDTTWHSMKTDQPMLALATLVAGAWQDRDAQVHLESDFRAEIADRILIRPRKDCTLVQSILVYVAWSHCYLDSRVQTPAAVLHMAHVVLVDLGLYSTALEQRPAYIRTALGYYYLSAK